MKIKLSYLFLFFSINLLCSAQETPFKIEVINIDEEGAYKQMVTDAIAMLNEVLNSPEFQQKVETHTYDWVNLGGGTFNNIDGQTVFKILYRTNTVEQINLIIKPRGFRIGVRLSGTMGSTTPLSNTTTSYNYWMDLAPENYQKTVIRYASHIAHEYCHQKGFYDKNVSRQYLFRDVVPYAIGDIVCDLLNAKYGTSSNCKM